MHVYILVASLLLPSCSSIWIPSPTDCTVKAISRLLKGEEDVNVRISDVVYIALTRLELGLQWLSCLLPSYID